MALHGGGYTIDEWGPWAVVTLLAGALAAVSLMGEFAWHELLVPASLAALGLWCLLSVTWAAWPQNALVESGRYLFYAAALWLGAAVAASASLRRALMAATAGGSALVAIVVAWHTWRGGDPASWFDDNRLAGPIHYPGGMAAAMAVGFWPLVAFASDRSTPSWLRPPAAFGAGAILAAVIPTEARASLWALGVAGVIFYALCPTPVRSAVVVIAAVVPVLGLWHSLNDPYTAHQPGIAAFRTVGEDIMAVGAWGAVAGLAQTMVDRVVVLGPRGRGVVTWMASLAAAVALGVTLITMVQHTHHHPLSWARSSWSHAIQGVTAGSGQTRYGSAATGRFGLWEVAVDAFRARPGEGYGGGNFGYVHDLHGQSNELPFQAHSQGLEVMSTLGYPGLVLYLPLLILPLACCVRARLGPGSRSEKLFAAGLAASLGYFALHSQLDWIWHLAAVALPALVLTGVALRTMPGGVRRPLPAAAWKAAAAAAVLAALLLVLPASLAQRLLVESYGQSGSQAVTTAHWAGALDWLSSRPELAVARAELRVGDARAALAAARRAVAQEPEFWVGWQLRYLAASRLGRSEEAASARRTVLRLVPRLALDLRSGMPSPDFDHY